MPSGARFRGRRVSETRKRQGERLEAELKAAVEETAKAGVEIGCELTGATAYDMKNAAQRRSAPYARRAPHPPIPPAIANRQKGRLNRGFRYRVQSYRRAVIYNVAPEAVFFTGKPTRFMIARPTKQALEERIAPIFDANVRRAIDRAMRS